MNMRMCVSSRGLQWTGILAFELLAAFYLNSKETTYQTMYCKLPQTGIRSLLSVITPSRLLSSHAGYN